MTNTETAPWVCIQNLRDGSITCFEKEEFLQDYLKTLSPELASDHSRSSVQPDNRFSYPVSKWNGQTYVIDLELAKQDTIERLRGQRTAVFAELDAQFMINLEKGLDNSAVIAEKERLRNITNLVPLCQTADELAALTVYKT